MKEVKEIIKLKTEDKVKLKQNYIKALKDESFESFIKKYKAKC